MFTYSGNLGNVLIAHITLNGQLDHDNAQLLKKYLRGTTWAVRPVDAYELNEHGVFQTPYSKPVIYLEGSKATVILQKQMSAGMYADQMPEAFRKSYLPHENCVCKTPLEVISGAIPNAQSFGLVHVLPAIKDMAKDLEYQSVVVFVNCFEEMPAFVDFNIEL